MASRILFAISVCLLLPPASVFAADPVDLAASLVGRPYVWGAEGPGSFDCSGLMQYVHRRVGIQLPRRAVDQSRVGDLVRRQFRRGDLLFFADDRRRSLVTHVGIYEGAGVMIDASQRFGRVRRDNLDEEYWVERFMFGRRLAGANAPVARAPRRDDDRRGTAARVLGAIAEILIRRR